MFTSKMYRHVAQGLTLLL